MSKQATVHRTVKSTLENIEFDPQFPLIQDLRVKARKRIPGFAYNYLAGGCNEENNLFDNTNDLRSIHLVGLNFNEVVLLNFLISAIQFHSGLLRLAYRE